MTWAKEGLDKRITQAALEAGDEIPQTILEAPKLRPYDQLYWDCFMDLCGTRPIGQTVGWIPWTAIDSWARRHGVDDPVSFETLRRLVQCLDVAWLEHFLKKD